MNFIKTTALLTLMTLVVLFSATALGFDVISALFFAVIFNFFISFGNFLYILLKYYESNY